MVLPSEEEERARASARDVDAELAIGDGSENVLATYFQDVVAPSQVVLRAIACCLVGVGSRNQTLRFKRRNGGRPRKMDEQPLIDRETAAIRSFLTGDERALAFYLDTGPVSTGVRQLLAEAFSSVGSTTQKLFFKRGRAGNLASELHTQLKMARLGHLAEDLKTQLGTWAQVDDELSRLGLVGSTEDSSTDDTARKRAVRFVRQARQKPPE
jgi:hypothetical protein